MQRQEGVRWRRVFSRQRNRLRGDRVARGLCHEQLKKLAIQKTRLVCSFYLGKDHHVLPG